jgi:hypothetical protein
MGLAERRAVKDFQDNQLPNLTADITRLAGFAVPIEINWDQLAKADYASSYAENFRSVYFQPVINALKAVAIDDMGKDAIKSSLKKIVFCNQHGHYSPHSAISFAAGVITIDHDSCSNVDYIDDRANELIKALEKGL